MSTSRSAWLTGPACTFLAVITLLIAPWPSAKASTGCQLSSATLNATAAPNGTVNLGFSIIDFNACTGAVGTVVISANNTGGGNLGSAPTFSGGIGTNVPVNVTMGPNPGIFQVTATCTAGCQGATSLVFTVSSNVYALQQQSPAIVTTQEGTPVTLVSRVVRNGTPMVSIPVTYNVTGPAGWSLNPPGAILSDGAGLAPVNFQSPNVAVHSVNGSYCNPDFSPGCTAVTNSFVVRVGTAIQATIGNPLGGDASTSTPPIKIVTLDGGTPSPGKPIAWAIQSGTATLGAQQNTTDAAGEAGAVVNLGNAPGTNVVLRGTRTDTGEFADITLGINNTYSLTAVTPTSVTTGVGVPVTITVNALMNGLPSPDPVLFNVNPTGPNLTPNPAPTNGTGDATTIFTASSTGTYAVNALHGCLTAPNCPPPQVPFTINVVNAGVNAGPDLQANPGENLTLSAQTLVNGTPTAGIAVDWTLDSGAASPASGSSVSNGAGIAQLAVVIGSAVPQTVSYTVTRADGLATDTVAINVIPPTLTLVSGSGQSGLTGTTTTAPLIVELRDGKTVSSPLVGRTINWSTLSGPAFPQAGTSVTDGLGRASVFANYGMSGGGSTIQAIDAGPGLASVNFTLTSQLPTLVGVSGNNQSGAPGATIAPLVVRPENNGAAVVGNTITWAVVNGGATLNTNTSTSDGAGLASVIPTLPINGGTSQIRATRADAPGVQFLFTITGGGSLVAQSGDGQTGQPNTAGAQPLVARLTTQGGAPVPGVAVTWSLVSGPGSASLTGLTSTTNANGDAAMTFGHGATSGTTIARASVFGGTTFADFTINTSAQDLVIVSGDGQTAVSGYPLAAPLVVRAESGGSPTAGVGISWTISGPGTLSQTSSVTDAAGQAQVEMTSDVAIGAILVTATRNDSGASVTFMLNAGIQIVQVSGNNQTGPPFSVADGQLVVSVTDGAGHPAEDVAVFWTVRSGGATVGSSFTSTNSAGIARVSYSFGPLGTATIEGSVLQGLVTTLFTGTATASRVEIVAGQGQSAPPGTTLPIPLRLRVVFPASVGAVQPKGLFGIPVTWSVTAGDGTLTQRTVTTDANGESTATLRLGPNRGANRVRAEVQGNGSVEFLANGQITNATMTKVSGDNQTLPTNTDTQPLVVRLADSANAGVEGVVVTWAATNAIRSAETCTTNASGQCSIRVRVDLPGAATVTARTTDPNAGPVTFAINGSVAALANLDPRQSAIAGAIDASCPALAALGSGRTAAQNDLFQRCREIVDAAGIDPDAASDALSALFPDVALVQSTASLVAAQAQQDNLKSRLTSLRSNTRPNALAGLTLTGPGGQVGFGDLLGYLLQADDSSGSEIGAEFSRWGFFATGQLGRAEADATSLNPSWDLDVNGLTVGVDYRKSDRLVLGAAVGYTRQDAKLDGDIGTLDTNGYSVSGYSSWYFGNNGYLDGVFTFGNNSYDLERRIQYTLPRAGGGTSVVDQIGRSSSDGDMMSLSATIGRDFQHEAWSFGPYGRFVYSRFGFDETVEQLQSEAGSGLGMVIDNRDVTSLVGVLGGRASYVHSTSFGILMPNFTLEYEHEFKDDPAVIEARFINDPTATPILVEGNEYDSSFLRLGVGLSMVFSGGKSGFVMYERTIGRSSLTEDQLNLGMRIEF